MNRSRTRAWTRVSSLLPWGAELILTLVVWMLFVSKWDKWEICVGVAAACITTFATYVVQKGPMVYFAPYPRWVMEMWRIPGNVIVGTKDILHALFLELFRPNGAPSHLQALSFDPGNEKSGASEARRALAITYSTCTPNFIAIGIDSRHRLLLFHQVYSKPASKILEALAKRKGSEQ